MKQGQYIIPTLEPENERNWLTDGNTFGKLVYLGRTTLLIIGKRLRTKKKESIELQRVKEVEGGEVTQ